MTRQPVKSSNLKSVGYDPATQTLEVEFGSGQVWQYHGVGQFQYDRMLKSKSVGKYFHREVRTTHKSKQVA